MVRVALAYLCIIGLFFAHLFYPQPQLFLNPEYGRSDVSHFNIPVRYIYDQALSHGEMPLWSKDIGTGFPIYAESQMGTYFAPNLLLFGLLPFWIAFNLSYLVAFFLGAYGMYMLARKLVQSDHIAFVAGLMFAFSGFFVVHTNHLNMLQTAALIPWIMWAFLMLFSSKNRAMGWFSIFVILISQQILAGHMQTSFMTGVFLLAYSYKDGLKKWGLIIGAFAAAFVLSAVQILPSFELHGLSIRSKAFSVAETTHFSLHPKSFLTLLNPNILGKIQDGSYLFLKGLAEHGNIFWETNLYIGLVAVVLLCMSVRYLHEKPIRELWIIALGAALLMLGRYSPLYLMYSIPPFNIFTTPARFNIIFIICIILISAYVLKHASLRMQKIVIVVAILDLFIVWYGYGVTLPISTYMKAPPTARYISADTSIPVFEKSTMSVGDGSWSKEFTEHGWQKGKGYAEYFNDVSPNMNVLWGVRLHQEYIGRIWTQRKFVYDQNLHGLLDQADVSPSRELAQKFLDMGSVDYLVATVPMKKHAQLKPVYKHKQYTVYKNTSALPRFRMTDQVAVVTSVEDIMDTMLAKTYAPATAYLEDDVWIDEQSSTTLDADVKVIDDANRDLKLEISTNKEAVLVVADLYYPGWKVFIDGKSSAYYPANMIQRAVVIPAGTHTIQMTYTPLSYIRGKWISAVAYLIALLGGFLSFWKAHQASSAKS